MNKSIAKKFRKILMSLRPVITLDSITGQPSISISIERNMELGNNELNARIFQLGDIREKLIEAADAIQQIQSEAEQKKYDLEELRIQYETKKNDNVEVEKLLQVNQDSFARLLIATNKRTEKRTIIIGIIIGFITGFGSGFLVWFLTKP